MPFASEYPSPSKLATIGETKSGIHAGIVTMKQRVRSSARPTMWACKTTSTTLRPAPSRIGFACCRQAGCVNAAGTFSITDSSGCALAMKRAQMLMWRVRGSGRDEDELAARAPENP